MKRILFMVTLIVTIVTAALAVISQTSFRVAYHQWQMNAAYESVFANPEPTRDELAAFSPITDDVEGALTTYVYHRQRLTDLGGLVYLNESFPYLASDGSKKKPSHRRDFVKRLWKSFPYHRHHYLDRDGKFEAWVSPAQKEAWQSFFNEERNIEGVTTAIRN